MINRISMDTALLVESTVHFYSEHALQTFAHGKDARRSSPLDSSITRIHELATVVPFCTSLSAKDTARKTIAAI